MVMDILSCKVSQNSISFYSENGFSKNMRLWKKMLSSLSRPLFRMGLMCRKAHMKNSREVTKFNFLQFILQNTGDGSSSFRLPLPDEHFEGTFMSISQEGKTFIGSKLRSVQLMQ